MRQRPPLRYCGKIWPNGEFGVSRQRETPISLSTQSHPETDETQFNTAAIAAHGIVRAIEFQQERKGSCYVGLSLLTKPHKKRNRGEKGISSYGQKMVRNAAHVLERDSNRKRVTFATVTLPSVTVEESEAIVSNWSKIVKVFLLAVGRDLRAAGLPSEILSVTEMQESRRCNSGVNALHLHFLFQGTKSFRGGWVIKPMRLRQLWKNALKPHLTEEKDWSACENLQRVRKSAVGYLGKYMSKGVQFLRGRAETARLHDYPSAWWNCTFSLRKKVKKEIIAAEPAIRVLAEMCQSKVLDVFLFLREIIIQIDENFSYPCGWYGKISEKIRTLLGQECSTLVLA